MIKTILSHLLPAAYKPFTMFPYPYVGEKREILTGRAADGYPYAEHLTQRVYFPKEYSEESAELWYRGYLEDEGLTGFGRRTKSPHCYIDESHYPDPGDIIVDVGCSEGFFSRHFAARAGKIYLFESDGKWVAPLQRTFSDCQEKVVLTQKFVGVTSDVNTVRLDDVIRSHDDEVYFIKMDIEGAEREVIESSREFLMSHRVKISCCAYHRPSDGRYLTKLLRKMGYLTRYSKGWMLFFNRFCWPSFRRGVIYARNF